MGLKLTTTADYALRAMIHMAFLPAEEPALKDAVARACHVPSSFMAKILRRLVRAGLLSSTRGAKGGFRLARPAGEISVLDVVTAIEGPLAVAPCSSCPCDCPWCGACPADEVWREAQAKVEEVLRSRTLGDMVDNPRPGTKHLGERIYEVSNGECRWVGSGLAPAPADAFSCPTPKPPTSKSRNGK
ncbi:MAG: Rrf2 family transcriptional regulator [Acidobacteriota bacterium]|nr:Rrf2 family transcriptional regulator [Acidobacteriota bacterium]MDQ7087463.1 Rrf2 family transcriptional regulator [Acidobacteriota bacterium]